MDLSRLLRTPIVVEHITQDGPPDGMGDPTEESTWSLHLGYVWQENATDNTANAEISVDQSRLALARTAAGLLTAGDRIYVGGTLADPSTGERFDIDGAPWDARNPRTQLIEYVQARLVRTT